jgi:hypothetical protein
MTTAKYSAPRHALADRCARGRSLRLQLLDHRHGELPLQALPCPGLSGEWSFGLAVHRIALRGACIDHLARLCGKGREPVPHLFLVEPILGEVLVAQTAHRGWRMRECHLADCSSISRMTNLSLRVLSNL